MAEYDSVIPAGESGTLTAKIHTRPSQNGVLRKSIAVSTDMAGYENFRLTIAVEVVAPIVVKPRFQLYINTLVGESKSEKVLLHRTDNKKLEVSLAAPVEEGVTIRIVEVTKADKSVKGREAVPGDVFVEATLANPTDAATINNKVILKTNHPDQTEIALPMTARVRGLIEARPAQVRLWLKPGSMDGGSMIFRLRHNRGRAFSLTEVASSHPEVFTASAATSGDQANHSVRVDLVDGLDVQSIQLPFRGSIRVTTPESKDMVVPVLIASRSQAPQRVRPSVNARQPKEPAQLPFGTGANRVRPTGTPNPG